MGDARRARRGAVDGRAATGPFLLLSGASATFFASGLLSAYERQLWPLMFYASAAYLLKLWYIDRMTFYYEQHRKQDKSVETQATTSPTPV